MQGEGTVQAYSTGRWVWQGAGQGADQKKEAADAAQQVTGHVGGRPPGLEWVLYTSHPLCGRPCKVNLVEAAVLTVRRMPPGGWFEGLSVLLVLGALTPLAYTYVS